MGKKYKITIATVFIMVFIGIITVNIEYNRINGKAYDEGVYKNVYADDRKKSDAFGEFVINRNKGVRIRMYYTKYPFDLRFTIGNKVFYVNGDMFKGKQQTAENN